MENVGRVTKFAVWQFSDNSKFNSLPIFGPYISYKSPSLPLAMHYIQYRVGGIPVSVGGILILH